MRVVLLLSQLSEASLSMAGAWASAGDAVTVVLLDRAAAAARAGHPASEQVIRAQAEGLVVFAHDDALRRRALVDGRLLEGVKVVDLDEVADLVVDGADKAVWL